jgi:S1-C subfamily serine protease
MITDGFKRCFLFILLLLAMIQIVTFLGHYWMINSNTMFQSDIRVPSSSDTLAVSGSASDMGEAWQTSRETEYLGVAVSKVRAAVVYITGHRKPPSVSVLPPVGLRTPNAAESLTGDKMGSGIIYNSKGFIVTNFHVIADIDPDDLRVSIFADRSKIYPCEVVAADAVLDLAIIKIDVPYPLPFASFGNSDLIEVGDEVLAVGCPFNLEQSVTHGIISDVKRTIAIEGRTYIDLIQTDAVINSGNSGGALIDRKGSVIGINVAIYAPNRVFCGVGFAIPINRAKLMIRKLQYQNLKS